MATAHLLANAENPKMSRQFKWDGLFEAPGAINQSSDPPTFPSSTLSASDTTLSRLPPTNQSPYTSWSPRLQPILNSSRMPPFPSLTQSLSTPYTAPPPSFPPILNQPYAPYASHRGGIAIQELRPMEFPVSLVSPGQDAWPASISPFRTVNALDKTEPKMLGAREESLHNLAGDSKSNTEMLLAQRIMEKSKEEEEHTRMVATMLDRIGSQKADWWKDANHEWRPFVGPGAEMNVSLNVEGPTENHPLKVVTAFATRLAQGPTEITKGELFLLVCLCQAVRKEVGLKMLHKVVKICVPSMKREALSEYLGSIVWLGGLMSKLWLCAWGDHGVQLLMSWNYSVADYTKLKCGRSTLAGRIVNEMKKPKYINGYRYHPDVIAESLPAFIHARFQNLMSYRDVCKGLGYNTLYIKSTESKSAASDLMATFRSGSNTAHQRDLGNGAHLHESSLAPESSIYIKSYPGVPGSDLRSDSDRSSDREQDRDDCYDRRTLSYFEEWQ